jgi:hypothetical protein
MFKKSKSIIPVFLLLLLLSKSHAQEMLGIMNSNFTGVNSGIINPANTLSSDQTLNINLLAGDVFISSNYIYIHKKDYGFLKIFRVNIMEPQFLYIYNYTKTSYSDSVYYFDYFKNSKPRNVYQNARIVGPSVMYRKGKHAFSFITGFRNNTSVVKLSYDLANFLYRGLQFSPQQNNTYSDEPMRFTALSWAEIGLGYAYTIHQDYDYVLNAGISVKALLGFGAAYGVIKNLTYMVPNRDSIYVNSMNGTVGFSMPFDAANNTAAIDPLIKGTGIGFDFGISYLKLNQRADRSQKSSAWLEGTTQHYLYKVGISVIDVGKINFNKSVQVNEYNDVNNALWSGLKTFNPTSLQQVLRAASYNFLGDSAASLTSQTRFGVWLPTAASVQFDYNFGNNFLVNATMVQGIRLGQIAVRRPTLISVTPRYETRYFEVNLPFSFYDFRDPQIGLAIRIFSLVIGTEKLGTFLTLTDVNGMDVYFALGFNIVPKQKSRSGPCDTYENYQRYQKK